MTIIVAFLATMPAPVLSAQEHALGYINGIFNTESSAEGTLTFLAGQYRFHNGLSEDEFDQLATDELYYNKSGCPENGEPGEFEWQDFGCLLDLFEAGIQSGVITTARDLWELEDALVTGSPAFEIAEERLQQAADAAIAASEAVILLHIVEIRGKIQATLEEIPGRLALVAHSQGNFFANDAVNGLDRVGMVSVGSPTSNETDEGPGPHVMAGCDILSGLDDAPLVNAPSSECGNNVRCRVRCHSMATYVTGALTEDKLSRSLLLRAIDEVWQLPPDAVPARVSSVHIDREIEPNIFQEVATSFCDDSVAEVLRVEERIRLRIFGDSLDLVPLHVAMADCSQLAVAPSSAFFLWREAECTPMQAGERTVEIRDLPGGELLCQFSVGIAESDPPDPPMPVPADDDFLVNSITAGGQNAPDVAALPNGGYVAVWSGPSVEDPGSSAIFARLFDADAVPLTNDFRVSGPPVPSIHNSRPTVAVDDNGNFIVAWEHSIFSGDIKGRWYDSSGEALGGEFFVNAYRNGIQRQVDVAASGNQQAAVVWESLGALNDLDDWSVKLRVVGPHGPFEPGAVEDILVNVQTTDSQVLPSVAMSEESGIVIAWTQDPGTIRARQFTTAGSPLGGEILDISAPTASTAPRIALEADGGFVIAWWGNQTLARRFGANGNAVGSAYDLGFAGGVDLEIALDDAGNLVAVSRVHVGNSSEIFGRSFQQDGSRTSDLFQINTYTSGFQQSPAIGLHPEGGFLVLWHSERSPDDLEGSSIRGRLYEFQ